MLSFVAVILSAGAALAQTSTERPDNATICDWYAIQKYGSNTTLTQGKLMQSVVALAFAGRGSLPNINPDITGILNPGVFENEPVNLLPWLNGSIDSTNLNNQPVGIDWLDGGGTEPLYAFLSGSTETVEIEERTNEFRLFAHFFRAFSFVFGCTQPPPRIKGETGTPLSLAYVHKFMELNHTHLSHFINQLTLSAVHFGFSTQDSNTLELQMNSRYNVRCLPGITLNPAAGPQLFSLCQAESCPLAAPVADCEAYVDLGPQGASRPSSTGSTTPSSTPSPTTPVAGVTQTVTTPPNPASSSPTAAPASSGAALSGGPIAGIAIGGAALVLGFVALMVWLLRKRKTQILPFGQGGPPSNPSYATSPYPTSPYPTSPYQGYAASNTDPHTSYMSNPNPHQAELWTPPPVEIGNSEAGDHYHGGMISPEMKQQSPKTKVL